MAKSIDPFRPKRTNTPEQLAKATGRAETPPPAVRPVGITGNPPLPTGKVVGVVGHLDPTSLTDIERAGLMASGWTPDVPLPSTAEGLKQIQAAVAAAAGEDVPPPVPLDTPPVRPVPVPLGSLPHDQQARLADVIAGITAASDVKTEAAKKAASAASRDATVPGLSTAYAAAEKAAAAFQAKIPPLEVDVTAGGPQPPAQATAVPPTPPQAARAEDAPKPSTGTPPASETGADARPTTCPHCERDLAAAGIEAPADADKMAFLHCLLGDRPYVKTYSLFGGRVEVTFRTLTIREIDVVYRQAFADNMPTELDYYERLNRYRFLLQLQSFRTTTPGGIEHSLPDGYSKSRNPNCEGVWVQEAQEAEMAANETGLKDIEAWLVEHVLKTETVFRVANNACRQFNRLAAKMEAMADSSDFW